MSELFSAVTPEMYEDALTYSSYIMDKSDITEDELWMHLGHVIEQARREYRRRFVDWFAPRHVEQAKRELAESIVADLSEVD